MVLTIFFFLGRLGMYPNVKFTWSALEFTFEQVRIFAWGNAWTNQNFLLGKVVK